MTALRKALAALFLVFATVAFALTPGERVVLFSSIRPVWTANFLGAMSLPSGLTFSRSSTATYFNSSGVLSTASNDTPRFDYDPSTLAPRGLLMEEARTNLLPYSNLFTSWTITAGTPTGNLVGPDGVTNSGWTFTENASGSNQWQFYRSFSTTSGTYTMSAFVKAGTQRYMQFGADTGTHSAWVTIDTTNFSTSTGVGGSATIASAPVVQTIANGWYRVSFAFTLPTTVTTYYKAGLAGSTTPGSFIPTYAGTSKTGSFYGIQLEAGSFPTSYIPNATASTVTRTADVVAFAGVPLAALQGAAFSTVFEFTPATYTAAGGNDFPVGAYINGGARDTGYLDHGNGKFSAWNGSQALQTSNSATVGAANRIAFGGSAAGRSLVGNGGTVAMDANAPIGIAVTSSNLGYNGTGPSYFSGWYRSAAFYNQRLPDAKLKSLSVVGAPW